MWLTVSLGIGQQGATDYAVYSSADSLHLGKKGTNNRGMVRDLLDSKDCLSSAVHIRPSSVEELSKDGVEGLPISLYL